MFHKICVFMVLAGLVGVAGAAEKIPQIITSEVFYDTDVAEEKSFANER